MKRKWAIIGLVAVAGLASPALAKKATVSDPVVVTYSCVGDVFTFQYVLQSLTFGRTVTGVDCPA
jgi:hypothetical protein